MAKKKEQNVIIQRTEEKIIASQLVEDNSREYGYSIIDNLFPSPIDGLKKVQRRILWSIHKEPQGKNLSSTDLVSKALSFHPYGDASTYDAAVRLSQPFESNFPLIWLEGDCGTYGGDKAADRRYTEMRMSEFAHDMFLEGVDTKTFFMIPSEDMVKVEPAFFIPRLPFALMNGNYAVGFGHKSWTIPYDVGGICSAVMAYAKHRMETPGFLKWNATPYARHFVPHFAVDGYLRNREELIEGVRMGVFNNRVVIDGIIRVTKDSVWIKSLPPFSKIGNCIEAIMKALRDKNSYLGKNCVDYNSETNVKMAADIRLIFKKSCNIFEAYEQVKRLINGTGFITPINNYCTNNTLLPLSPVQVLVQWYNERYNSILKKKKYLQMRLARELGIVEISITVHGHTDEVIKIIRGNDDNTGIEKLKARFDLTTAQAMILRKIPLGQLSKTSKDELVAKHKRIKADLEEVRNSYGMIHHEIYDDAKMMKKKYVTKTGTTTPQYHGYLHIDNEGIIQFQNEDDIIRTLAAFPRCDIKITQYPKPPKPGELHVINNGVKSNDIIPGSIMPEVFRAKQVLYTPKVPKYTVCWIDGRLSYVEGFKTTLDPAVRLLYLHTNKILTFTKDGKINRTTIDTLSQKKSICAGATSNIIHIAPDDGVWPKVVVSMNDGVKNNLKMQLLQEKDKNWMTIITGSTHVLDVINNLKGEYIYTLPPSCIRTTAVRYMKLTKLPSFFEQKPYVDINVNLGAFKKRKLRRNKSVPAFVTI